jgi:hypothetical protein
MKGRPSEYSFEICKEICERVRQGEHIHNVLKSDDRFPTHQTWYNWLYANKDLLDLYHACRRDKAEVHENQYMELINDVRTGKLDPHAGKVVLDANRWLMQVYNNKLFGNKIEGNGTEEVSGISIVIHKKDAE